MRNSPNYSPIVSDCEIRSLRWRDATLRQMAPREILPKPDKPESAVFTDAGTKDCIIAATLFGQQTFRESSKISMVWEETVGQHWRALFDKTSLIYGLEMIAFLSLLWGPNPPPEGETSIFHLYNEIAVKELVKHNAKPDIITAMAHLAWFRLDQLGVPRGSIRIPSNRNIADIPTRKVKPPFGSLARGEFKNLRPLYSLTKQAVAALQTSRNIPMPKYLGQ